MLCPNEITDKFRVSLLCQECYQKLLKVFGISEEPNGSVTPPEKLILANLLYLLGRYAFNIQSLYYAVEHHTHEVENVVKSIVKVQWQGEKE